MKPSLFYLLILLLPSTRALSLAGETERALCEPQGLTTCLPDTLRVVMPGTIHPDESVLELPSFVPGTTIDTEVALLAETGGIQAWTYAVRHDPRALALVEASVTLTGTDVEALSGPLTFARAEAVHGGYASAVVLALVDGVFVGEASLPPARYTVCRARYTLVADPGAEGALIRFVDGEIGLDDQPPIAINLVAEDRPHQPETVSDGLVRIRRPAESLFVRGDINGDGAIQLTDAIVLLQVLLGGLERPFDCVSASDTNADGEVNLTDAIALLGWLFAQGRSPAEPFPACGAAPAGGFACSMSSPACE